MPLAFLFFLAGLHPNAFTAKGCWADVIWKYFKTNYFALRWERVKLLTRICSEQSQLALWNQWWPYRATFLYFSLDCWRWEQQKRAPSEEKQSKVSPCSLPFLVSFERFSAFLSLELDITCASIVLKLSCGELRAFRNKLIRSRSRFYLDEKLHRQFIAFSPSCVLNVE